MAANDIWSYTISGLAGGGQTWETSGTVVNDAVNAFSDALEESFRQLTNGKAIFGKPGLGCHGPYTILKVTFQKIQKDIQ